MNKFLLFVLALGLWACTEAPPSSNFSSELGALFQSELEENGPGGAVLVMKGDRTIFSKGYGLADLETGEKITPNTLFNTGSVSKTFEDRRLVFR